MILESNWPMEILYRDDHIVVIDKPPAMLTHINSFDRHSPTVVSVLGSRLGASVHTVHRLDRMTTGAMVLALNGESAGALSGQFRDRTVGKEYLAIVRGHLDDSGTVDNPVPRPVTGGAAEAETDYTTLARGSVEEAVGRYDAAWFSLVHLVLHTGRTHQARRHLHQINHPVLGDNKHGDKAYNRWAASRFGEKHLYLRAYRLEFLHPATGASIAVTAGVPRLWRRVLADFGMELPGEIATDADVRLGPA